MGLLTNILLAPFLGPIYGTRWTLDKVDRVVREELTDDTPIKEDLMALQMQLEMGEVEDAEYVRREAEIMQR
ncbi:MAG TPA: gas vesicle protein GvpG, partial [Gemmatimonadaceae bacterium]|nr:gas vesicle protein GvpG [Gemmatimonadaceae bacterium]